MDLTNKTAFITGASRGIGAAAARKLASLGANVALMARSENDVRQVAEGIGDKAIAVVGDVANYNDVKNAIETCVEKFGGLDICPIARIEQSDPNQWGRVVDINVKGVYHCMQAAHPHLSVNGGVIINLSSGAASNALEGWSHYCATKAAVLSLTKCGHKEWSKEGIRVVGLSPGTVATDMQEVIRDSGVNPVSQMEWSAHIPVDDVAQAIAWLTQDESADFDGGDFSIKTPEGRQAAGLSPLKAS